MGPDNNPEDDSVDITLIRWMLWLEPAERLMFIQEYQVWLPRQTEAQKLAVMRRTLEEKQKGPFWPKLRVQ